MEDWSQRRLSRLSGTSRLGLDGTKTSASPSPLILCRLLPWTPPLPRLLTPPLVFQSHLLILRRNANKKSTAIEFPRQPDPTPVPWVLFPQLFHLGDLGRTEVVFLYMSLL